MVKQTRAFKDILLDQITSQRKRIETLMLRTQESFEENKGRRRGNSNYSVKIIVAGLEGTTADFPRECRAFKTDPRDIHLGSSLANQIHAFNSSLKADSAWSHGDLEQSFKYLLEAEHLLGVALADYQVGGIQSVIAQRNATMSHRETKSLQSQVINRWRKDVDPKLSAQQAADELLGRFHWKDGTDVAHRTLAKWIAQARKNTSPLK